MPRWHPAPLGKGISAAGAKNFDNYTPQRSPPTQAEGGRVVAPGRLTIMDSFSLGDLVAAQREPS
jgi:hypothetical protein